MAPARFSTTRPKGSNGPKYPKRKRGHNASSSDQGHTAESPRDSKRARQTLYTSNTGNTDDMTFLVENMDVIIERMGKHELDQTLKVLQNESSSKGKGRMSDNATGSGTVTDTVENLLDLDGLDSLRSSIAWLQRVDAMTPSPESQLRADTDSNIYDADSTPSIIDIVDPVHRLEQARLLDEGRRHPVSNSDGLNNNSDGLDNDSDDLDNDIDEFDILKVSRTVETTARQLDVVLHTILVRQAKLTHNPARPQGPQVQPRFFPKLGLPVQSRTFPKFMELPAELRVRIYEFALEFDEPIRPHACDAHKSGGPMTWKFHHDGKHGAEDAHNQISQHLAITRTSKQVREESLTIFYGVNTFSGGQDTFQYFQALEARGLFALVRKAQFRAHFCPDSRGKRDRVLTEVFTALRHINNAPTLRFLDVSWDASMFLSMRMLSRTFHSNTKLVLQVPVPDWFENPAEYPKLKWFLAVANRMGLNVKLVPSGRLYGCEGTSIVCDWVHRLQDGAAKPATIGTQVMQNIANAIPGIAFNARTKVSFYRRDCAGNVVWYEEV
ncbi:hypothetical protein BU16DRAFT_560667 [Lophium mytilinum]|uniref:2EXR domain-containing protein n=1 Tax=Lophium mytilinum TaxID=390894 RepID=A0A6A6QUE1_9PEZI|nr:hypothetical protein BU16DRAFT_560667 [Lophium mytilinum]